MPRGFRDEDEDREPVTIANVECVGATKLAIRVRIDGALHWVPQSQVTEDSEVYAVGHKGSLTITGWFAAKEGLGDA